MKASIVIYVFWFVLVSCTGSRQEGPEAGVKLSAHPWFDVTKITPSVLRIDDHGNDNIYLIIGRDSALLIDSGVGAVDLAGFVKTITHLPLIVVNTHGHPDHVGSNNQFGRVYAHPQEFEMIRHFTEPKAHDAMLQYLDIPDSLRFYDSLEAFSLSPVTSGHLFDLGDRQIEVIDVPGHTAGSICLLDKEDQLLFTGDHVKSMAWLHMDEALPIEVYLENLRKLALRKNEFSILLSGHDDPLDIAFLSEQIKCAENIISGSCEGEPYESVVGDGLVCQYERAKIAYKSSARKR